MRMVHGQFIAQFQPTPPSREATISLRNAAANHGISTHTSLAGGDGDIRDIEDYLVISTHTSLAGGDAGTKPVPPAALISTHTSLAGGDHTAYYRRQF